MRTTRSRCAADRRKRTGRHRLSDRADNAKPKHQGPGAIRFAGETDQLHLNTRAAVTISDPEWQRRIVD